MIDLCSEVWVINCTLEQQYKRLVDRDNLSLSDAKRRIESQLPLSIKNKFADEVIDNSRSKDFLIQQIIFLQICDLNLD